MTKGTKTFTIVAVLVAVVAVGFAIWYGTSNNMAGTRIGMNLQSSSPVSSGEYGPPAGGGGAAACSGQGVYTGSMPGYQQVGNTTVYSSEVWTWKTVNFSPPIKVSDIRFLNANSANGNSYNFEQMVVYYTNGNTSVVTRNSSDTRCANHFFGITDGFSHSVDIQKIMIRVRANDYQNRNVPIQVWVLPN